MVAKPLHYLLTILVLVILFSCKGKKENYLFENMPSSKTGITFNNKLEDKDMFNILYYLYFYNGGGVATGDINNDGLPDIYFTANTKANNKLYLNKGNFTFEDITVKAGVAGTADWCSGVTMADVNADGFLDIYVIASSRHHGLQGRNELFINNKNGTFTESAVQYGLDFSGFGTQAAFFDYDRDGDLDCYLLNHSQKPNANIKDTANRRTVDPLTGDHLYRNDIAATGKFTDVSQQAHIYQSSLGYGLGLAIADINNDGWDDIYVGNDFHENDYYYINNGDGTFTESGAKHFNHYSRFSMGNDVADYNNDGQVDIVTVDMLPPAEKVVKTYGSDENFDTYKFKLTSHGYQNQYSRNCLQQNTGNGNSFKDIGLQSGIAATDWSWAPLFADLDNDGNKDLLITSGIVKRPVDLDYVRFVSDLVIKAEGDLSKTNQYDKEALAAMPDGASHPFLYKGDGKYNFADVSDSWGTGKMKGYYNGAAYADLDNDGNLDLVINCINSEALILKNNSPKKYTLDISFKGNDSNRFGIGTKAWIFTKGKMQYQQLTLTRGFQSSSDTRMHFGLDSLHVIDSMLIVWPNQKYQVFKTIPVVGKLEVRQSEAGGVFNYASFFPPQKEILENVTGDRVHWSHKENPFLDFNKQYLIPHMQSTRGPKLAVADINKDGLDDIFVCGATEQAGQLLVQNAAGKFNSIDSVLFNKVRMSEDVDALFFDADNNGFADLYVVSGGNQYNGGDSALADHLYMNDGKGHFTLASNAIPVILKNKSCVTAADIDNDGDQDLFIGGLADAKQYGIAQPSYLLINDGKGIFKLADDATANLAQLGIVTAASFTDINKDGWQDLLVTGEWMPLKVFINNKGKFTAKDVAKSTGLWQSLYVTDVNGDGFTDVLAGNWGHNCKLSAGKNGPVKLYVKDFDKNGSVEQIMCYTMNGEEYTFLAKDELERPLPILKKAYLKYSDVAGKTVQYMFHDLFNGYTELQAETLSSSCFINDGKGGFTRVDLPDALQLAPVFSFASLQNAPNNYIAAGNFYGVVPYEGRYDALAPTSFMFNKTSNSFTTAAQLTADGEVRDMKWLRTATGNIMAVARNNSNLLFFK